MNEFELVSILDIYARTFPKSFKCFALLDTTIQTKYGLTLVRTGDNDSKKVDEMHILMPGSDASITSLYGAENMKKLKSNLRPYQKT